MGLKEALAARDRATEPIPWHAFPWPRVGDGCLMWTILRDELTPTTVRYAMTTESGPWSIRQALQALAEDAAFRTVLDTQLATCPLASYRFETPGVTQTTADRPFEFVLVDSPGLIREPDPFAFVTHFALKPGEPVVCFDNVGRDARLIVPTPLVESANYPHLAAFTRGVPVEQRQALWRRVGEEMLQRLSDRPVWLNTAGMGVAWLHIRLDDRPKYYAHGPYRRQPV